MSVVLLNAIQVWVCPSCGLTEQAKGQQNRFHQCPRQRGMTVPLVLEGTKAKHVLVERDDYEGSQIAQKDDSGRAIMSILTIRDDGYDNTVLAPTAVLDGRTHFQETS